jgi:hypothetical protein
VTSVKYAVRFEGVNALMVEAHDVEGFFVGRYSFDDYGALLESEDFRVTFSLVQPTKEVPPGRIPEDLEVLVLDGSGNPMGRYSLWNASLVPSGDPGTLIVTAMTQLPPHVEARSLWDRFRVSEPRAGEWRALPIGSREGWVEVAGLRHAESAAKAKESSPRREVVMEGDEVKDVASFFCAIGEAFHGPGGYFGENFTALEECLEEYLRGAPVRLIWRNMDVARSALSAVVESNEGSLTKLDLILRVLARKGVEVVLGAGQGPGAVPA